ncbi:MAG: hypothetical protein LBC49_00225 [Bacteroidales bacterium]|jgi:hypothetical protein|nr:hypothetical protein [Bacteroidales bacterium]
MKRKIIFLFFTFSTFTLSAQWKDDFKNGLDDWHGTTQWFCADDSLLRSCGEEKSSTLFLLRQIDANALHQWEFAVKLEFNPSSTNYLKLYLLIEDTLKNGTAENFPAGDALYIRLGESGGKNHFQLYRTVKGKDTLLATGRTVFSSTSGSAFKLRIIHSDNGYLKMYSASWGKYDWEEEIDSLFFANIYVGASNDTNVDTEINKRYMFTEKTYSAGIYIKYTTATRHNKYTFDYMSYGINEPDPEPLPEPVITLPDTENIKFSEILFDVPSGNSSTGVAAESKFIEIYNNSDSAIMLSTLAFMLPNKRLYPLSVENDYVIEPYGYAAITPDITALSAQYTICYENIFEPPSFPTLNAGEGTVYLCRTTDTLILETLYYNKNFHHILLPQTKGVSLERIDFNVPSTIIENWHSASQACGYATPGCKNSQANSHQQTDNTFSINPQCITPNNDGVNDYTEISWDLPLNGYVATVKIFDDYGRDVATLKKAEIISPQDKIIYHGTSGGGGSSSSGSGGSVSTLRSGIYILFIELIHPDTGKKKRYKYPLVIR